MKKGLLSLCALAIILSFLCFSGCNNEEGIEGEFPPPIQISIEPNMPHIIIQGKVTDMMTEESIQGIEMKYKFPETVMPPLDEWTRITDENGDYVLPTIGGAYGDISVVSKDKNGLYKPDTVNLTFEYDLDYFSKPPQTIGDFEWLIGPTYVATADFKLEKQ